MSKKKKTSSLADLPLRPTKKRKTGSSAIEDDDGDEGLEEVARVGLITDERMRAHMKFAPEEPKKKGKKYSSASGRVNSDGSLVNESSDDEDDPLVHHEVLSTFAVLLLFCQSGLFVFSFSLAPG